MKTALLVLIASLVAAPTLRPGQAAVAPSRPEKFTPELARALREIKGTDPVTVWVYFTDKGSPGRIRTYLAGAYDDGDTTGLRFLSERSLKRRHGLLDATDVPLFPAYVANVSRRVLSVRHASRWFNAVSVRATRDQLKQVAQLSFVDSIDLVARYENAVTKRSASPALRERSRTQDSSWYGPSYIQLQQLNVPAVHRAGNYGQGVLIGMFDAGFASLNHPVFDSLKIAASHDFVLGRSRVSADSGERFFGGHGLATLSAIAGFAPGHLIGPAFKAEYVLSRTEDEFSETPLEEDNFVAAIEWADSIGIDIASISLGYLGYDAPFHDMTWKDMDGNTALITRAADLAVAKGILVIAAAGNETPIVRDRAGKVLRDSAGNFIVPNIGHNTLGAPADGDSVLAIGAVFASGQWVPFSALGPTADGAGRIKPDLAAMGYEVVVATADSVLYELSDGTSFACPLTAGVAALVLGAHPGALPLEIHEALKATANNAASPNNVVGWGIPDALRAIEYLDQKRKP